MKTYVYYWLYFVELFLRTESFQAKVVEKRNTHSLNIFFSKIIPFMR